MTFSMLVKVVPRFQSGDRTVADKLSLSVVVASSTARPTVDEEAPEGRLPIGTVTVSLAEVKNSPFAFTVVETVFSVPPNVMFWPVFDTVGAVVDVPK